MLSFATRTWDGWDYIPHAWPIWLTAEDGVLLVGCAGEPADGSAPTDANGQPLEVGRPLAVARVALLSEEEAWLEGIRVDPRVRGMDVATDLQIAELQWAAALGAGAVRYATGERNEASHRLGARHGFALLAALRTYWWSDPATSDDEDGGHNDDDASGFGEEARRAAGETRTATLERLAERGLLATDGAAWWSRVSADPTFTSAARLYEHRAWALQELTWEAFDAHVVGGEVVALESAGAGWGLAILQREALPSEDVSLHLGLLVGDGAVALQLAETIRGAAGTSIRFRLPADDPPLLRGQAGAFASAGFRAREWTLHILGRRLEQGDVPSSGAAGLILEDEPARDAHAPAGGL